MPHHPPDVYRYFRLRKLTWRVRHTGFRRLLHMAARRAVRPAWFAGIFFWSVGCTLPSTFNIPTVTPSPSPTPAATAAPSGWERIAPGMELRHDTPPDSFFARLTMLRIDPAQVTFRVHYRPGEPLFANGWRDQLPDAAAIINANFFDSSDRITGVLFTDGVQHGTPYRQRGGTFYVQNGMANIQSNLVQPYANEQYQQAVQAFPMLVTNGEQSYFDARADRSTRRTVIATDAQGRVLIIVTSFGGITLLDLAAYLPATDLNITDALNLDGGGSTLLDINAGDSASTLSSFDPVPAVIAVYPR